MTPGERKTYFRLWQDACLANEWFTKDDDKRRAVVLDCMRAVGGPLVTTSSPDFGPDETTALLVYLRHLGDAASFDKSAEWDRCKQDYKTFNRARQADWHEQALYGAAAGGNKLDRNRFAGRATAAGGVLDDLDAKAVKQRHLTVATRHQAKLRKERREGREELPLGRKDNHVPDAESRLTSPPPRSAPPIVDGAELPEVPF